jgi:hypothetical protein
MNSFNKIRNGKRNLKLPSFSLLIIVLILVLSSCKQKPEPYSILEFTGDESVMNYSKSLYMFSHTPDSANPAALIASDGDMICYGDKFFIFRKSQGNKFNVKSTSEGGYINSKLTCLELRKSDKMIQWFKNMNTTDLSALEFIKIDTLIPEAYYPYLTDLARLKPGIGLCYDGDLNDISVIVKIFNPKYLLGNIISVTDNKLLSGLTNLELLVAEIDDSVSTGPLPVMPALKHLFLTKANYKAVMNDNFLSGNRSVERVTIMESEKIDLSLLKPLNNLKELVIFNFDTIENFELLKNHVNLEVLAIVGDKSHYHYINEILPGIRWMTFSPNVVQGDFNFFIENHPNLEVAEILDNDTISSLSSLAKLKNLYGLTVTDTLTDLSSIKSLRNLKYLSLPSYVLKDKTVKDDLQKLLPRTRIVANEGFCLGSGWLLLVFPLIILFSFLSRKRFFDAHNTVQRR